MMKMMKKVLLWLFPVMMFLPAGAEDKVIQLPLTSGNYFLYSNGPVTGKLVEETRGLRLDYQFAPEAGAGDFIAIGFHRRVAGVPECLLFEVESPETGPRVAVRYRDSMKETFQKDQKAVVSGLNRYSVSLNASSVHWGGNGDGIVDAPAVPDCVVFSRRDGCPDHGSLLFRSFAVKTVIDPDNPIGWAELRYSGGRFPTAGRNNIFSFEISPEIPVPEQEWRLEARIDGGVPVVRSFSSSQKQIEVELPVSAAKSAVLSVRLLNRQGKLIAVQPEILLYPLPERPSAAAGDDSIFGINEKSRNPVSSAAAGIRFVRFDFDYKPPEWYSREEREQNLEAFSRKLAACEQLGLTPLVILHPRRLLAVYQPGGVPAEQRLESYAHGAIAPVAADEKLPTLADWGNWVREMVTLFKGRVRYYEIANEPDLAASPRQYAALAGLAWHQGRSADPEARFGAFSTAGVNLTFIEEALQAGMGNCFDFVTVHPYQWSSQFNPELLRKLLTGLEALLKRYGRVCPVWLTEIGYPSQPVGGVSPERQGELLAQLYFTGAALGRYKIFWYCSGDWPGAPDDQEAYFGIVDGVGRPKPAFYSLRFASDFLDGAESLGLNVSTDGTVCCRYRLADGRLAVGFWNDGGPQKLSLECPEISGTGAELHDVDFSSRRLPVSGGRVAVVATAMPQLLVYEGSGEISHRKNGQTFQPRREQSSLFLAVPTLRPGIPGETVTIPYSLIQPAGQKQTVSIQVDSPASWNSAPVKSTQTTTGVETIGSISLPVPARVPPGRYPVRLTAAGAPPVEVLLTVSSPVSFEFAPLEERKSGNTRLLLRMHNRSMFAHRGEITSGVKPVEFKLAPGEHREVFLEVPPTGLQREFELAGTLDRREFREKLPLDSIFIPRAVKPPQLNASWNSWNDIHGFRLDRAAQAAPLNSWWKGPDDLSAEVKLQYDREFLYFAARVVDDVHFQPSAGGSTWLGDGFQMSFGREDEYAYELLFALSASGPDLYLLKSPDGRTGKLPGARAAAVKLGNCVYYSAAIPWRALPGINPVPGGRLNFNFLLNDNDGAGRKGYLECRPGIGTGKQVRDSYLWRLEP